MKIKNYLRRTLLKVLTLIDTPSATTSDFHGKWRLPEIHVGFYLDETSDFNLEGTPNGIVFPKCR
jgi:hypothetical protein